MSPEHQAEIGLKLSRESEPQNPTCRRLMARPEDNNEKDSRERHQNVKKKKECVLWGFRVWVKNVFILFAFSKVPIRSILNIYSGNNPLKGGEDTCARINLE